MHCSYNFPLVWFYLINNHFFFVSFPVAWFCLDRDFAPPDVIFSDNNRSASCRSFGHRVILGAVGLSKGLHYWEISIDRYDNHTDLAFGIARFDVDKRSMLGK